MRLAWLLSLSILFSGCFLAEASPTKKLNDSVLALNEATRWGRIGTAAHHVGPKYRQEFLENHAHWGGKIQVAESEVMHLQVANDNESAVAIVVYTWYGSAMTLHRTVIKQVWTNFDGDFGLTKEEIVQGDAKLFRKDSRIREAMMGGEELSLLDNPLAD